MTSQKLNFLQLKNSNCDKTQKLKLWPNSKTQIATKQKKVWQNFKTQMVTKIKNSNCDQTKNIKLWGEKKNSKTPIVRKKKLQNCNCDKTQKLKLWQNSNTKIMTKLNYSNYDKIQKLQLWQNSKTQIVTKLKNSNGDQTPKTKLWQNSKTQFVTLVIVTLLTVAVVKKTCLLDNWWDVLGAAFCDSCNVFGRFIISKCIQIKLLYWNCILTLESP